MYSHLDNVVRDLYSKQSLIRSSIGLALSRSLIRSSIGLVLSRTPQTYHRLVISKGIWTTNRAILCSEPADDTLFFQATCNFLNRQRILSKGREYSVLSQKAENTLFGAKKWWHLFSQIRCITLSRPILQLSKPILQEQGHYISEGLWSTITSQGLSTAGRRLQLHKIWLVQTVLSTTQGSTVKRY